MSVAAATSIRLAAREERLSLASIIFTFVSYLIIFRDQGWLLLNNFVARDLGAITSIGLYTVCISVFAYSIIVYHISRFAYYRRQRIAAHSEPINNAPPAAETPRVAILIPSYCEEPHIIWQTVMSAALLDYPDREIVLLLDNPPTPNDPAEQRLLSESRLQIGRIDALFAPIVSRFAVATEELRGARSREDRSLAALYRDAAALYGEAADFLEDTVARIRLGEFGGPDDHVRRFFIDAMLMEPAAAHRRQQEALLADARDGATDAKRLDAELERLSTLFRFDVCSFERKAFANLTHAPNKASNLNAYLGVMGMRFKVDRKAGQARLRECASDQPADLTLRAAEFIVVLDADSFMRRDYLRRTMAAMMAPGNERIAVAQTPYKAIPGSDSLLERTAGASTDVHFCVAQGMSALSAGFWVGATALVRMAALRDIAELRTERDFRYPIFVPDRTLIEDADATIRMMASDWRVLHLPDHLNWSATPGDFGSLVIQRRRWANGGLIILPALLRHLSAMRKNRRNFVEGFLRVYHLLAAPITGVAGMAIVVYPFDTSYASTWVSMALAPYLYLHIRDLRRLGYEWIDFFRIFALNIILLPVVLGGVFKSIVQMIYGYKIPFARTPKIQSRTVVPMLYLVAPLILTGWSLYCFAEAVIKDQRGQAFPSLFYSLAFGYAFLGFIGVSPIVTDLAQGLRHKFIAALGLLGRRPRPGTAAIENIAREAE